MALQIPWLTALALLSCTPLALAASSQTPLKAPLEARSYAPGDPVPITCLNRTIETGEHITSPTGSLQYIPFPTCAETSRPLELVFNQEGDINCTIDFVTDDFFHLLEFYVHSDVPLSCRVPARPAGVYQVDADKDEGGFGEDGPGGEGYVPMVVGLAGALQLSHLHVGNQMNLLVHTASADRIKDRDKDRDGFVEGGIEAATAYSVHPAVRNVKVTIGDPLPLRFSVRWYAGTEIPLVRSRGGGGGVWSTLVWCAFSAGVSAVACVVWFRGVELPRRLKGLRDGAAARRAGGYGYGLPAPNGGTGRGGNGYGYGVGGGGYGFGVGGIGKKD